ncbi:MAG: FAD binding domain-containing protein [Alphaproteobacteria bacterium]|jgi:carbon-monoxide dehydrogenase medium subunit|nr:FAD binding domain-containing protein [Alphaproteobacteria bacterium]
MISQEVDFEAPSALPEALALLARHGDDATLLSGGMSLMPMTTLGLVQPGMIISLNHIAELDYVREDGNELRIGALTRHADVAADPLIGAHAALLAEAASLIGDVQVRNRGTIGGSIAHADPAANYLPAMLALGARLRLQSEAGERSVEAKDFVKGIMTTAIETGEMLTEIAIPKLAAGTGCSYQRLVRVEGNFAIVIAAAITEPGRKAARVGLGNVAPGPVLVDVSGHLGNGLDDAALAAIGDAAFDAAAEAASDLAGDANYRREMARVFARRAVQSATDAADAG